MMLSRSIWDELVLRTQALQTASSLSFFLAALLSLVDEYMPLAQHTKRILIPSPKYIWRLDYRTVLQAACQ